MTDDPYGLGGGDIFAPDAPGDPASDPLGPDPAPGHMAPVVPPGPVVPPDAEDADRDAFAGIVFAAVDELRAALQEPYATQLGEVAIVTEDQAPPEKRPPGGDLYGLFEGVPRNRWAADWVVVPAQITIYRRTHEAFFRDRASLEAGVRSTVRHEVAHYFGTDEAGIRAIERESRTEPPR